MKKLSLLLSLTLIMCVMASCAGKAPAVSHTITDEDITDVMDRYLVHERYTKQDTPMVDTSFVDDSGEYFKVSMEEYDTWEEWTSFCESIFAGEALRNSTERFINVDGYTYCRPGSVGWYISGIYTHEVLRSNEDRALVAISRPEISPGEDAERERVWFYLFGLFENGWRIIDVMPFA